MKTAIVLFNLGAPDSLAAVKPFLTNLFSDPAIIRLPRPVRQLVARRISARRAETAREIYRKIGGRSPLRRETEAQARALEKELAADDGDWRVFVAMRHWHPMAEETAGKVAAFGPGRIVLLPLYPQFSTTTTASSNRAWRHAARVAGVNVPTHLICCYPTESKWIAALAAKLLETVAGVGQPFRVLFSAHGLPRQVVARGDPYQWQIEQAAAAVAAAAEAKLPDRLDWRVCYQSKVGPLEWIGPSTESEIVRAGAERRGLVIVPISFVSEHSETLVELDITLRARASAEGAPFFHRVATVGTAPDFIAGLADLVRRALGRTESGCSAARGRLCPTPFSGCPIVSESQ